jgi:peroxiredoxin
MRSRCCNGIRRTAVDPNSPEEATMNTRAAMMGLGLAIAAAAAWAQTPGASAPGFTLNDAAGKTVALADFKGKFVVLEWTNPECPFVQKHYFSRNMQGLQKEWGDQGVVWLSINSTNANHVEFKTGAAMASWMRAQGSAQKATLIDSASAAGRAYAAKTTPQMFVIDPSGKVIYNGAIDDKRSANPADVKTANNYVRAALNEAMAGKPVTTASTSPYGCSVKY